MKVTQMQTSDVIPYEGNPRVNDKAVKAVAASIQRFGFNTPIVVDESNVVIAGHTRLLAAKQLSLTAVPVLKVLLSTEEAGRYRIADNKTAEFSEWTMNDLIAELRETTEMSDFFPRFNVDDLIKETAGVDAIEIPTQGSIEIRKEQIEQTFTQKSDKQADAFAEARCPKCDKTFYVDRHEVLRRSLADKD